MNLSPRTSMALERLLEQAVAAVGADCGDMQLLDQSGALIIVAAKGFPAEFVTHFRVVPAHGDTACARALRRKRPVIVTDVEVDPEMAGCRSALLRYEVRSVRSIPLTGEDGSVLGVLSTHRRVPAEEGDGELERLRAQGRETGLRVERLLRG